MRNEIPIAERFKRLRKFDGRTLTQADLARVLDLSRKTVNAIEGGRVRRPHWSTLSKLKALEKRDAEGREIAQILREFTGWR